MKKSNEPTLWFVHIGVFRVGTFTDAKEATQEAWIQFCQHIMELVNKKWKEKIVKENSLMSDICTVSDETFAYEVGNNRIGHWVQKYLKKKNGVSTKEKSNEDYDEENLLEDDHQQHEGEKEEVEGGQEEVDEEEKEEEKEEQAKTNARSYYKRFYVLQALKRDHRDDWDTWDFAFQEHFAKTRRMTDDGGNGSQIPNVDSTDTEFAEYANIEFEPW